MKYPSFLLFVFYCVFTTMSGHAQKIQSGAIQSSKKLVKCFTVESIKQYRQTHPNAETDAQFEAWLGKKTQARKAERAQFANYKIPIIFHIINSNEAIGTNPNLAASSIAQQVIQLNKDYANLSGSQYTVAANTGIQFVLAKTDTLGNTLAEPGIDRISFSSKSWTDYSLKGWTNTYIDETVKPTSIWNPNNYYNIWVIPKISSDSLDLLGYATFPTSSTLQGLYNGETATTAGVVVQTVTIGSAFAPYECGVSFGLGKTLSHETGHFFGLRHIWGDTDCGNDFCDDTPVHLTSNKGVPSHPKPNSCGTADEMFENYMDYTDDIVLNTFTANQADRMQTVMLNSPRRVSLNASPALGSAPTATNAISFENCTGLFSTAETGNTTTYPRYKDVYFTINPEDKATGTATVTLNVTGTAKSGTDYKLLTSSAINFVAGDGAKSVGIRIFDNAKVDGDKTIIIKYTIAGAGVIAGTSAQSVSIDILDDDNIKIGENTITILNENFETPTGTFGLPANWGLLRSNGGAYKNPFVAGNNGDAGGSGNCAYITNNPTTKPNTYTKGIEGAAVLQSPLIDGLSVLSVNNLSFEYKVKGLIGSDQAFTTYTYANQPTGPFYFFGTTPGVTGYGPYAGGGSTLANSPNLNANDGLSNSKFYLDFYWQTGTSTAGGDPGFNVDDVKITATPFHVETAVSNSYSFDVKADTSINNFKSTNNKVIASIDSVSENVPDVTVKITAAGTNMPAFTTAGGSFTRTAKVFDLNAANTNSSSTYQATLYFTEAELAAWGADKLNLKIMQVNEGVDLNTTLSSSNAALITATVNENTTAGYIAYSGKLVGLSQVFLVAPNTVLPGSTLDFTLQPNQSTITLLWNTLQETNNKGFVIERSLDGSTFTQIGFVKGKGTTTTTTNYTYTDNLVQANVLYFYRLRQVSIDNRAIISPVHNAKILAATADFKIFVSPNPATDHVNIFVRGTANNATIQLYNAQGQLVKQVTDVNTYTTFYNLPIVAISRGLYTVVVILPEGRYTKKLLIE